MEADKQVGRLYEWKKEIIIAQLLSIETCIDKLEKLNKEGKKIFEEILTSLYDIQCMGEERLDFLGLFSEVDTRLSLNIMIQNEHRMDQVEEVFGKMKKYLGMIEVNFENLEKVMNDCFENEILQKNPIAVDFLQNLFPNILSIEIVYNELLQVVPELGKDLKTKERLIKEVRELIGKNTDPHGFWEITHHSIKQFKYLIYIWTFRPYLDEDAVKILTKSLTTFFTDYDAHK